MNNIKEIFKTNEYPKFITDHKIFNEVKFSKKVFPSIGLSNCKEESIIELKTKAETYAIELVNNIFTNIFDIMIGRTNSTAYLKCYPKSTKAYITKLNYINDLFKKLKASKRKVAAVKFITNTNNKITIGLPFDILDNNKKYVFRKGEGLFKIYNKLFEMIKDTKIDSYIMVNMPALEDISYFKSFSAENMPIISCNVVFSSTGKDGIWDITTMSMRGFRSCQSWDGDYNNCLIGSILDPFVGIVYLTSNTPTKYGNKMIRRCMVRYIINKKEKQPYLYIDNMYPSEDASIRNKFVSFLEKRSGLKVIKHPIGYSNKQYYIPYDSVNEAIKKYDTSYHTNISSFAGKNESVIGYHDQDLREASIVSYADSRIPHLKFIPELIQKSNEFSTMFAYVFSALEKDYKTKNIADYIKISHITEYIIKFLMKNNFDGDNISSNQVVLNILKEDIIKKFGDKIKQETLLQLNNKIINIFVQEKKTKIKLRLKQINNKKSYINKRMIELNGDLKSLAALPIP